MTYTVPLLTSQTITCDASGHAQAPGIGPSIAGTRWQINLISVQNDSQINQSQCLIYLNGISASLQIGGTWSGNMDTDNDQILLQNGDKLIAVWTGADAGSHSIILVSGLVFDDRSR